MSHVQRKDGHSTCPKKLSANRRSHKWLRFIFPVTGLFALIWFLVRVIPKPSRATYPCQRVAFPLASSFVIWLLGLIGSVVAFRRAKKYMSKARYVIAAICVATSVAFIYAAMSSTDQKIIYGHEPRIANAPMGEAKGVQPGRVVWIHDSNATDWAGPGSGERWYSSDCTNQQAVNKMLSRSLRALAGESSDYDAWDAIFRNFNQRMGKGDVGYTSGEKIGVKINMTLTFDGDRDKPTPGWWSGPEFIDLIDNSPQLTIALLNQLVNIVGVNQTDISIGDPSRVMPHYWYDIVHAQFPDVVYFDRVGGEGRTPTTMSNVKFYWSTTDADGKTQDYIPDAFADAEYFINFPMLKSHDDSGITVSGKNHYGSLKRNPDAGGYYNLHLTRATERPGMGYYRAIVDLMGHPELGGKTLISLIDGLFAGRGWASVPEKWLMAPFNNDWPSSIFISMDQVADDSVANDFLYTEWSDFPHKSGTDDYLHEAALANDPCSGAFYDPNHDGVALQSLGVHEHWNNATDKQYSRNLDPNDGTGIELVTQMGVIGNFNNDEYVNFKDFAVLAAAWGSPRGGGNWNASCDISIPSDGIIDERDLAVFVEHWMETIELPLIVEGAELVEVYSSASTYFEGPTWDPVTNKLYFTNRTDNQLLRLDSPGSATVWMSGTPETNGTFLSLEGRLLTADENPKQISSHQIGASGPEDSQVLADQADGIDKKPNDLCQTENGNIYFTGPDWTTGPTDQGVYLLESDSTVTRVASGLYQPNGIIASNDSTKLYVAESSSNNITNKRWWVFPINPNGTLGTGTVFFKPASPPSDKDPDGMTIDERGNLYFAGLGGIWIVSPQGEQLEMVPVPEFCSNITFGGPEDKTLYITCQDKVYTLQMNVRGGGF